MPPTDASAASAASASNKKGGKKGRAPAHQNTYAFRHNPKSKLTAQILAAPIQHCCRRCHDKLLWRKTYRKYRPLKKHPSTCNLCQRRNITAAYHTVCDSCSCSTGTGSTAADALLKAWNTHGAPALAAVVTVTTATEEEEIGDEAADDAATDTTDADAPPELAIAAPAKEEEEFTVAAAAVPGRQRQKQQRYTTVYTRVCAVCFKQPALPDPRDDEQDDNEGASLLLRQKLGRPLKLRELKSLRRQKEKAAAAAAAAGADKRSRNRATKPVDEPKQGEGNNGDNGAADSSADEIDSEDSGSERSDIDDNDNENDNENDGNDPYADADEDDPFLRAVGGADKLLTGAAYQKMLLETRLDQLQLGELKK